MTEETIVKRIHVSGLTPAISPTDLSQRLGSFGTVKALDGFGSLDGLGQPRKFGYVTLETTKTKLARCMNLLSGVTWKGTKLRLGEAKPDFRDRIAKEHTALREGEPPRKRRRLPRGVHGVHASDMSLVTPENVKGRGGWHVTPMGRIVKPMRMRPPHPLPDPLTTTLQPTAKKGVKGGTKKKPRVKEPPVRARRRTIDPSKWGSTQLKGIFLENAGALSSATPRPGAVSMVIPEAKSSEEEQSSEEEDSEDDESNSGQSASEEDVEPLSSPRRVASLPAPTVLPATLKSSANDFTTELMKEKTASLGLLQSLFGDGDDEEWGGRESIGSDADIDDQARLAAETPQHEEEESHSEVGEAEIEVDMLAPAQQEPTADHDEPADALPEHVGGVPRPGHKTKLKDLFAVRPEDAGFSLGQLDLDLDLDDDILGEAFAAPQTSVPLQQPEAEPTPIILPAQGLQPQITLDPSQPFFFPLSDEERAKLKGNARDCFDVFREEGHSWRTFCREETDEEIRQWWDSHKGELTKDWKRKHREAVKSRRRRGGFDGD